MQELRFLQGWGGSWKPFGQERLKFIWRRCNYLECRYFFVLLRWLESCTFPKKKKIEPATCKRKQLDLVWWYLQSNKSSSILRWSNIINIFFLCEDSMFFLVMTWVAWWQSYGRKVYACSSRATICYSETMPSFLFSPLSDILLFKKKCFREKKKM